jgi:DNA topoisomerase I
MAARRSKRGRTFYGCSTYPKCDFTLWDRPIPEPCPSCGAKFLVEKRLKGGGLRILCVAEGCGYSREMTAAAPIKATAAS